MLADDVGHIHRVALKTAPVPRLVGEAETMLEQRIIAGPVSTGGAVIVVTADRHVRALAVRDLSPVGSWALEAPLAGAPVEHRRRLLRHGSSRRGHGPRTRRQADLVDQLEAEVVGIATDSGSNGLVLDAATGTCMSAPGPTARSSTDRARHLAGRRFACGGQARSRSPPRRGRFGPWRPMPSAAGKP